MNELVNQILSLDEKALIKIAKLVEIGEYEKFASIIDAETSRNLWSLLLKKEVDNFEKGIKDPVITFAMKTLQEVKLGNNKNR